MFWTSEESYRKQFFFCNKSSSYIITRPLGIQLGITWSIPFLELCSIQLSNITREYRLKMPFSCIAFYLQIVNSIISSIYSTSIWMKRSIHYSPLETKHFWVTYPISRVISFLSSFFTKCIFSFCRKGGFGHWPMNLFKAFV